MLLVSEGLHVDEPHPARATQLAGADELILTDPPIGGVHLQPAYQVLIESVGVGRVRRLLQAQAHSPVSLTLLCDSGTRGKEDRQLQ